MKTINEITQKGTPVSPHPYHFPQVWKRVFRKRENIVTSEYAEKYRRVVEGSRSGNWYNITTPYLKEPMDCLCLPYVRAIYMVFAPQTGKTQVAFNYLCYVAENSPGPAMYIMPNESKTKDMSARIRAMFRATPRMAGLLSDRLDDTKQKRIFLNNGMKIMMVWASSVAELSSDSIQYMFEDERDKYEKIVGNETDPDILIDVRMNTYPYNSKKLIYSTPNDENGIVKSMNENADEIRHYEARCPVCGQLQKMHFEIEEGKLGGITWPPDIRDPRKVERRRLAGYQCCRCGMIWDDHMRNKAVRGGKWVSENPVERPTVIGFHLPSWYSPFVSLSKVAADFLRGKGDLIKHKGFVTQHKAEAWKNSVEKPKKEEEILKARCDLAPQTVPDAAVALTVGIDVQKAGFWFTVWAWARDIQGITGWLIHYGFLPTWESVSALVFETEYPMAGGSCSMRIWRAGLDTGGGEKYSNEESGDKMSMSEETYWWIVANAIGKGVGIFATKGASRPIPGMFKKGDPLIKTPSGKKLPDWFHIIQIDTNQMKDTVHFGLNQAANRESGALYLHKDTDLTFARHILAEEKRTDLKTKAVEWVRVKTDNHLLDASIIAISLARPQWIGGGVNLIAPRIVGEQQTTERKRTNDNKQKKSGRW
jgi:phage terminase large subunit GpA-like protein